MDAMYEMSQDIHIYSLLGLILVLLVMISFHKVKGDFQKFVRIITMLMIFHLSLLGFVILTGTVMMASKHLSFTPANLLMTVSVFIVLSLEIKRNGYLAKVIKHKTMEYEVYKRVGFKYLAIEFFLLVAVAAFSAASSTLSFF